MPAYNFQKQFWSDVIHGRKRQTIRAERKDKWVPKVGSTAFLYGGMRTKACRKLGEAEVVEVTPVSISASGHVTCRDVQMRDNESSEDRRSKGHRFAEADGFRSFTAMVDWFAKNHGLPFKGHLIRWSSPTPSSGTETKGGA